MKDTNPNHARVRYHQMLDEAMDATRQGDSFLPAFVGLVLKELQVAQQPAIPKRPEPWARLTSGWCVCSQGQSAHPQYALKAQLMCSALRHISTTNAPGAEITVSAAKFREKPRVYMDMLGLSACEYANLLARLDALEQIANAQKSVAHREAQALRSAAEAKFGEGPVDE